VPGAHTPEQVAEFELKGDPTEVSGTQSVKQFIAEGAEGKLGVRERDCACDPCMDRPAPKRM
jgi:hypothetical protein